jgi:CheY-like chemotaxis protein
MLSQKGNFMPAPERGRPIEILLVEDSPTDAMMTQEAFESSKPLNRIHIVDNGEAALAFLRRKGPYKERPRPDLILLDLNLPKKNGREVLQEIKSDDQLRSIPVVILTSSRAEEDIAEAYDLHANCYVTKPVGFHGLAQCVQSISDFWFSVVTMPPRKP